MRPDALRSLAIVREFLAAEVLPRLDRDLGSELKAALKVMRDAERELAESPSTNGDAFEELLSLCVSASQSFPDGPGATRVRTELADLVGYDSAAARELDDRYRSVRASAHDAIVLLREGTDERSREALVALIEALGRDARHRAAWQSVFVEPKTTSHLHIPNSAA